MALVHGPRGRYAELYSEDECDALLRMVMNPPMISRREVYLRRVIARDFPEPGCRTTLQELFRCV